MRKTRFHNLEAMAGLPSIKPISSKLEFVDFERLTGRVGVPDGFMRINVVASDLGGQATDCDVYIQVLDVNEPPTIGHIDGAQGENTNYPFVFDAEKIADGDIVGPKLPTEDPDTIAKDTAFCREATLESTGPNADDDRELFGISRQCQIYVKHVNANGKNLRSGTDQGKYTLLVDAASVGRPAASRLASCRADARQL